MIPFISSTAKTSKCLSNIRRNLKFPDQSHIWISGILLLNDEIFSLCVQNLIKNNVVSTEILDTTSKWFGITYKEDLEEFKLAIKNMKKENQKIATDRQQLVDEGYSPCGSCKP